MKQLMLGVVCLWIFLPSHSTAQRGGPGGFGGQSGGGAGLHGGVLVGSGFRGNQGFRGGLTGLPPLRPIPPLDRFGNFNQIQKHGNGGAGFGAFPLAVGYQDTGYYNGGTQGPVIILQQSEPPTPPPPPPPPAQPELREYMWRESKNDPSATFTILSKDGNSISAVAVWVQNNTVLHIAPNGEAGQIPLNAVDRQATRAVNAARNLILSLPAESSRHR